MFPVPAFLCLPLHYLVLYSLLPYFLQHFNLLKRLFSVSVFNSNNENLYSNFNCHIIMSLASYYNYLKRLPSPFNANLISRLLLTNFLNYLASCKSFCTGSTVVQSHLLWGRNSIILLFCVFFAFFIYLSSTIILI